MSQSFDADVLVFCGGIYRPYDEEILEACRTRRLRKNVILLLTTWGGHPDVVYRIARYLQNSYNTLGDKGDEKGEFNIFIDGFCKSAGTLLALGADRLIMSNRGELGPIDVQLRKPEEVGDFTSGLIPTQALNALQSQSLNMFGEYFKKLRFGSELSFSTKVAADIATNMTIGLLDPIYGQIDPLRLAEFEMSVRVSFEYGERIGQSNLKTGALSRLFAAYSSQTFVIDQKEAKELFKNVEPPDEDLLELGICLRAFADDKIGNNEIYFDFLSQEPPEPSREKVVEIGGIRDETQEHNDGDQQGQGREEQQVRTAGGEEGAGHSDQTEEVGDS